MPASVGESEPAWTRWRRRARHGFDVLSARSGLQSPGWWLLGAVLMLFVLGGVLGWVELRLIAVAGAACLAIGALFMIGRQAYAITLGLRSERVVVGQPAEGQLVVANVSDKRLRPVRIELPVGGRVASFALPAMTAGDVRPLAFAVPTQRRGVVTVGPARTVRGDPFGLLGREVRWTEEIELFVHPATVALLGRPGGFVHDLEGHASLELSNSDVAFHALREYTSGDDLRHVHWRSTARSGTLMIRQFLQTRRSHVGVGLDLGRESYAEAAEFELAVSVAASVAVQAVRDENSMAVIASTGKLKAVGARRTLDELSRLDTVAAGGAGHIFRQVAFAEPNASLACIVTGSVGSAVELRRAAMIFDSSVRVLAVAVRLDAELSVRNLDNLSLITVGDLADLPLAIRRAGL